MKTAPKVQKLLKERRRMNHLDLLEDLFQKTTEASDPIKEVMSHVTEILDTNYKKANIDKIADECAHLTIKEKSKLKSLLFKDESLFDGTLGA